MIRAWIISLIRNNLVGKHLTAMSHDEDDPASFYYPHNQLKQKPFKLNEKINHKSKTNLATFTLRISSTEKIDQMSIWEPTEIPQIMQSSHVLAKSIKHDVFGNFVWSLEYSKTQSLM